MPALPSDLRRILENAVISAREEATTAAAAALRRLAVGGSNKDVPSYLTPSERDLRKRLRAAARQLGDRWNSDKELFDGIGKLMHEVAYEHWHRMLFARFLAENNLLIHPEHQVPVDLPTIAELAQEEAGKTGAKADAWAMAGRFAAGMLPQIFRPDDPALAVQLAPEHQQALERILESLPPSVFTADDSLGWVYQFWQSAEKERVNAGVKGGDKITGETLPAVTQLFTEHYMVLFLLHNTIGAWHAAKRLAGASKDQHARWGSEAEVRAAVALPGCPFEYLRFVRDEAGAWRPAAGGFEGWPRAARELKVLDPCCGSGHFLVATLDLLVRIRMAEEGLDARDAAVAVIAENLSGLELDARCTQIAAFNVALAAWKTVGEHVPLGEMHIACSGSAPNCTREQWLALAETRMSMSRRSASATFPLLPTIGRQPVRNTLRDMHDLFSKAPDLGSLIDPTETAGTLGSADWETVKPFLTDVLAEESRGGDAETLERAVAAQGMAKAAEILSGEYTLVVTNVPYLGRVGQGDAIKAFCEKTYPEAKSDLATVFVARMLKWLREGGALAAVTPQNWLFLTSYKKLRERLLKERRWSMVARLGPGAFETIGGHVVNVALIALEGSRPAKDAAMAGIDASAARAPSEKAAVLRGDAPSNASAATGAETYDLQTGGNALQAAGAALQAAGKMLQADRSMFQTEGKPVRAIGNAVRPDRTTLRTDRTPAEPVHGAPAGSHGAQPAAPGSRSPIQGASAHEPTAAPMLAEIDDAEAGPEGDIPILDTPADGTVRLVPQAEQLKNPDARIAFTVSSGELLKVVATDHQGLSSGDNPRFRRLHWEIMGLSPRWAPEQSTVEATAHFSGREGIILWDAGDGELRQFGRDNIEQLHDVDRRGQEAWGHDGVGVCQMSALPVTRYTGEQFDTNVAVLLSRNPAHLPAIWCFCSSPEFGPAVRRIDQALKVTNASLVKVPFDLPHWQKVAAEKYPNGLPEPQSDDPTQWLFHGQPAHADLSSVLQVAVARLIGYRWPAELDEKMRLAPAARALVRRCRELESHADDDGVVPLVNINKEQPGSERLRALLEAAYAPKWTPGLLNDLLAAAGSPDRSLDEWVKHDFFAQHCSLFHQRPFVWQVWDGRKDGFNILVHYHRLAAPNGNGHKLLTKITYTYLGDWITQQQAAAKRGEPGADARLKAAQDLQKKLEAILAGEPPYDLFIRWKPLHEQPIGWNPDINDGVRMNIRPFVTAGVLRGKVNVKWTKDRGKEPESIRPKAQFPWFWSCPEDEPPTDFAGGAKFTGERLNDLHYTNEVKQAARKRAMGGKA